ncbi:DUF6352 family protein [Futiania mangrovi]|uniref:DUF6352 family protein n=1 Tax=Futiania mangrovi TaxID=2959716 RepID=A0A9J6P9A9_9PROT|nr:DUF6352 family protein [Futiania mangrovii]MCP1335405.1 DUF6352 family protein [Futiania mangrovii]
MSGHALWASSGRHLLEHGAGELVITDDFLRAYLRRPELVPPEEACMIERGLYAALLDAPSAPVDDGRVGAMDDPDAVENWRVFLRFRDILLKAGTVEGAYRTLFAGSMPMIPPMFVDQLVHAIVHDMLAEADDPMLPRSGELLFRTQKISVVDAGIMCADEEIVEMHARTGGFGGLGELLREAQTPVRTVTLDVLNPESAEIYWARANRFDTVLDLSFARPGQDAFARVLEGWVARMAGLDVSIQPVQSIRDERWRWHIGLDATATAILNDLYEGREVEEARLSRLLALFRMEVRDDSMLAADVRGRPIYLGLAMDRQNVLRMKPQNLIVNLPLARAA